MRRPHVTNRGYVRVHLPEHPNAGARGWVLEHIAIAASVCTGGRLPDGARVHHIDGVKTDNRPGNLLICQDQKYHLHLHKRQRALEECGDPNKWQCYYCRQYDDATNMAQRSDGKSQRHHLTCAARWQRELRARKRAS